MKKILSTIVLAALLVGTLSLLNGCGSKSEFVGEWEATAIVVGGQEYSLDDYKEQLGSSGDLTFDVKSNGKITLSAGESTEGEGKWEEKDGKITITDDSKQSFSGELKDGKLQFTYSGTTFICEKK